MPVPHRTLDGVQYDPAERTHLIGITLEKIKVRFLTTDDIESRVGIAMGELDLLITSLFGDHAALNESVVLAQAASVSLAVPITSGPSAEEQVESGPEAPCWETTTGERLQHLIDDIHNLVHWTERRDRAAKEAARAKTTKHVNGKRRH